MVIISTIIRAMVQLGEQVMTFTQIWQAAHIVISAMIMYAGQVVMVQQRAEMISAERIIRA
jgi:hypothetical protein